MDASQTDRPGPLSHCDDQGRAQMVDIGGKTATERRAVAAATLRISAEVRALLLGGQLPKGDALAVARIAGIQAAKATAALIPLCHAVPLAHVGIDFAADGEDAVRITAVASTVAATGVEMEAMIAASVSALTLYDMVKGRCRDAEIRAVRLLYKSGGRSGTYDRRDGSGS